jgi:hypothetical protein
MFSADSYIRKVLIDKWHWKHNVGLMSISASNQLADFLDFFFMIGLSYLAGARAYCGILKIVSTGGYSQNK